MTFTIMMVTLMLMTVRRQVIMISKKTNKQKHSCYRCYCRCCCCCCSYHCCYYYYYSYCNHYYYYLYCCCSVLLLVVVAFSSLARIWGECSTVHSPPVLFLFFFFFSSFLFLVEISPCTLIPLFMPRSVHSGSASWDDCGRTFPDKLRVSSFPDRFPHYARTAA